MIPFRNIRRFFYKAYAQPLYALRVLYGRMRAYFYFYTGSGRSGAPEAITFFLTHRCNLRCKMCGQWGESGVTKKEASAHMKEELSLEEFKKVIDGVSGFRPGITLFGGEPLLYPHCIELIRYIKKNNMHCLMITNGALLEGVAREIVTSGIDELNLSLDGARGLHDEIRGMPGLYDRIMNGIREINRLKKEYKNRRPLINLQCTITKYNYTRLGELLEAARDAEASSLTFHNLIFLKKELIERQKECDRALGFSSRDWEGFVFDPEISPEILYDKIKEIMSASSRYGLKIDFYPNFSLKGLKEYYNNPEYLPSEFSARCLSPWITAYIFPDGEVRPCLNFDYSYGNIKKNNFMDIWNGSSAIIYRKALKARKIFPVCVRCTELYRY